MEEVMNNFNLSILEIYNSFVSVLPKFAHDVINLFLLVLLIVIYSVITWHGYRFIAKKDPLKLNLNKYNHSEQNFVFKLKKSFFYFVEYLLISPLIIFAGFSVFTILLTVLTETSNSNSILIASAAIVGAIRITSYYKEDLSKELAKFLPFTLLAISILNLGIFNIEKIISHSNQIPNLFNHIIYYLLFIIILEITLRFFDFIFSLFGLEEIEKVGENEE